jgi:uncharacterized protein (DUF362 family)
MRRRAFLGGAGTLVTGSAAWTCQRRLNEAGWRADVFIGEVGSYEGPLTDTIRRGLAELGISRDWAEGRSILLKPNLVEPSRGAPQINTHPNVVRAAAEVFRSWGAREVLVAEGQGHCRDSHYVLDLSGLGEVLDHEQIEFVDLNHDDVEFVPNRLGMSRLQQLGLPRTLLRRADRVVSLPKLKTHHWVGVTLGMKNLFGVMPGIYYGWPKNVLHQVGISESILDINAAVEPDLTIVDAVIGMEGDGPIMGTPKPVGVLVMGTNLPAVDASCARLMKIDPWEIPYLRGSSGRLGPIAETHITQRGEPIEVHARPFQRISVQSGVG